MSDNFKKSFVFVLGREQEIALNELKSVLGRFDFCFDIYKITRNLVFANIDNFTEGDAARVMDALAGTIKIFEIEGSIEKDIALQIARIFEEKKTASSGKINFGISYYGRGFSRQIINSIALTAKKELKGQFSLRYVESRDSAELSTILTLKNNLASKGIEFGLFENQIGVLIAFNNPEEWNKRDYGKPASDKFSGMVPPKLARMMVNIALAELRTKSLELRGEQSSKAEGSKIQDLPKPLVLDPFCGSGNILMEAMMLGYDVVGSDISEKAVSDSQKNIEWLKNQFQVTSNEFQVFRADATSEDYIKLATSNSQLVTGLKNFVFVTEPYLGEPKKFKPTYKAAVGEYAEIKKLYLNFLKNIKSLSSSGSAVKLESEARGSKIVDSRLLGNDNDVVFCLVFPLVETLDQGRFSLYNESVDEIKKLGYTQACNSLTYGRDYQVVKREIILLKFQQ